jgi:hypothetical protein
MDKLCNYRGNEGTLLWPIVDGQEENDGVNPIKMAELAVY